MKNPTMFRKLSSSVVMVPLVAIREATYTTPITKPAIHDRTWMMTLSMIMFKNRLPCDAMRISFALDMISGVISPAVAGLA